MMEEGGGWAWLAVANTVIPVVMLPILAVAFATARRARSGLRDAEDRIGKLEGRLGSLRRIGDPLEATRHLPLDAVRALEDRVARLEHSQPHSSPAPYRSPHGRRPYDPQAAGSPPLARQAPVGPDVELVTSQAALALQSLHSFRRFVGEVGGSGLVLRKGASGTDPVSGPDADAENLADLWKVSHDGAWLVFPGFNLVRQQSLLLADAGRLAQDRLGWLFEIRQGDQLIAEKPARMADDGTILERGVLILPT